MRVDRQRDRETERQRDIWLRDRETERQRNRETERQRDIWLRDRETERQRDRETSGSETERQRDRETERQRDIWLRDRETEKQRDRETERRPETGTGLRTGSVTLPDGIQTNWYPLSHPSHRSEGRLPAQVFLMNHTEELQAVMASHFKESLFITVCSAASEELQAVMASHFKESLFITVCSAASEELQAVMASHFKESLFITVGSPPVTVSGGDVTVTGGDVTGSDVTVSGGDVTVSGGDGGSVGPLRVEFSSPVKEELIKKENPALQPGGRFRPRDCVAQQKVAIIIPFRNREEHLKFWLYYLHPILQRQQLDYGVYVVNQILLRYC
ncbi:hypothetical protein NQZ68_035653 [Dissostichus eleginoides]|nr:hypothetical protein NQZ68_035653 [Dissostichus eleginoides]